MDAVVLKTKDIADNGRWTRAKMLNVGAHLDAILIHARVRDAGVVCCTDPEFSWHLGKLGIGAVNVASESLYFVHALSCKDIPIPEPIQSRLKKKHRACTECTQDHSDPMGVDDGAITFWIAGLVKGRRIRVMGTCEASLMINALARCRRATMVLQGVFGSPDIVCTMEVRP